MDWLLFFILFLFFPILYSSNRTGFYIHSLLYPTIGFFLLNKVGYSLAYTSVNAELLAIIIIVAIWGNIKKRGFTYLIFLLVFVAYFSFDSIHQGVPVFSRLNIYKKSFIMLLWGCLLIDDIRHKKVSAATLRRFFIAFVIFELVLGPLQLLIEPFGDFFRNVQYVKAGEISDVKDVLNAGYMYGTFRGSSAYAGFLSLSFAILAIHYIGKKMLTPRALILLAAIELVILMTGIRAALLFTMLLTFFLLVKYKQGKAMVVAVPLVLIIFLIGGISAANVDSIGHSYESGGIMRSLSLFSSLSGDALTEQSTFALSINMIPYISQNPLLGVGYHFNQGYFMVFANRMGSLEDFSSTSDAMLLFEIAEIGIIGLIIFLWPLWRFIKWGKVEISVDKLMYIFFFCYLILSTVVDSGFMSDYNLLLFFFAIVFFINGNYNTLAISNNKVTVV